MNIIIRTLTRWLGGTVEPSDEYRIKVKKKHLKGNRYDTLDCFGYRAFVDAVETKSRHSVKNTFPRELSWCTRDGFGQTANNRIYKYYAYGDDDKFVNMMMLTEEDIGKEIVFKLYKRS